jgi:glutathione synthase/RimK-type ligase-like ATP-grasp enzyme
VVHDFENDLFPAYSSVMTLKPVSSSGGKWVFLLNDTDLAMLNQRQMPTLYISVQGQSGSYSYSVPVAFSTF